MPPGQYLSYVNDKLYQHHLITLDLSSYTTEALEWI